MRSYKYFIKTKLKSNLVMVNFQIHSFCSQQSTLVFCMRDKLCLFGVRFRFLCKQHIASWLFLSFLFGNVQLIWWVVTALAKCKLANIFSKRSQVMTLEINGTEYAYFHRRPVQSYFWQSVDTHCYNHPKKPFQLFLTYRKYYNFLLTI